MDRKVRVQEARRPGRREAGGLKVARIETWYGSSK